MRLQTRHALVLLPAALALAGCGRGTNGKAIHASGHIEATEVRLAAKVGGRLLELPFQEGDAVAAGAVVARFDTVDAAARAGPRLAPSATAPTPGCACSSPARAPRTIRQAEAELARSQRRARRRRARPRAPRGARRARHRHRSRRATTPAPARDGREPSPSRRSRPVRDKLIAGPRREEIEGARAQRAAVEASIATIRQRVADATVARAARRRDHPARRRARRGAAGRARCSRCSPTSPPRGSPSTSTSPRSPRVRIGDTVTVTVDGRAESFTGRVSFVAEVGGVHAEERADPRGARQARLQGQGRTRQRRRRLQARDACGRVLRHAPTRLAADSSQLTADSQRLEDRGYRLVSMARAGALSAVGCRLSACSERA